MQTLTPQAIVQLVSDFNDALNARDLASLPEARRRDVETALARFPRQIGVGDQRALGHFHFQGRGFQRLRALRVVVHAVDR